MGGFFKGLLKPITAPLKMAGKLLGGRDASKSAMPYLNQIPQYGQQAYNPFIQQGAEAGNMLNPIYQKMAQDPNAYINEMMGKYQTSPGYDYRQREMLKAAMGAASAGGFAGSPEDQGTRATMVQDLLGGDMQEYLQNRLNLQGVGLQGLENRVGRGFQGSGALADYLGTADLNKANLKFQGVQQKDINQNALLQSIIKAGATAYGASHGMPSGGGGAGAMTGAAGKPSSGSYQPLRDIGFKPTNWSTYSFNPGTFRR